MKRAIFKTVSPYAGDVLNLPVQNVDEAVPFYENRFGFRVVSRNDSPHKSVILARDDVQIGLAENGGDSSQEGCFFGVDDVEAAYREIKGTVPTDAAFQIDEFGSRSYRVFFEVAPDGLCYMLGQPLD